jgi:ABC-2 type transport system ATP-binding protein
MITVKSLTHNYVNTRALDNVTFSIPEGTITALIGPNGSGKTTLLRCISTLEKLQYGSVYVNGTNISEEPRKAHQQLGYLADNFGLYDDLSVRQSLWFTASSCLVDPASIGARIEETAEEAGVTSFIDRKINTLSRGMRQRVGIAQAIIHKPKVVILDEPASGLDPEARVHLSELLLNLQAKGMTLIVSSHILAELEDYSSDMLILKEGRLIEHRNLKVSAVKKINDFRLVAKEISDSTVDLMRNAFPGLAEISLRDGQLLFSVADQYTDESSVLAFLVSNGVAVKEFGPVKRNLQDEYLRSIKTF